MRATCGFAGVVTAGRGVFELEASAGISYNNAASSF